MARRASVAIALLCSSLGGLLALAPATAAPGAGNAAAHAGAPRVAVRVALTRERGQNDKLRRLLQEKLCTLEDGALDLVELPCIEHGPGPDREVLEKRLRALAAGAPRSFDAVALTSPEAARVFLGAWGRAVGGGDVALSVPLACVGRGTSSVVEAAGHQVAFEPSLANAETLAAELPRSFGQVLYPASARAQDTLQKGLASRGFSIERLDTYTTRAVQHFSEEERRLMEATAIATFGSPSAVKAWAQHCTGQPVAACIGGTSRKAAEAAGFPRVVAPERPGLEGWAEVAASAVRVLL